jgi:hypothetical protein
LRALNTLNTLRTLRALDMDTVAICWECCAVPNIEATFGLYIVTFAIIFWG